MITQKTDGTCESKDMWTYLTALKNGYLGTIDHELKYLRDTVVTHHNKKWKLSWIHQDFIDNLAFKKGEDIVL